MDRRRFFRVLGGLASVFGLRRLPLPPAPLAFQRIVVPMTFYSSVRRTTLVDDILAKQDVVSEIRRALEAAPWPVEQPCPWVFQQTEPYASYELSS